MSGTGLDVGTPDELAAVYAAVEGLYSAFATRGLRRWTDPCLNCCATLEEEAALHAVPLRELSLEVMRPYAASAVLTWGDGEDFAYFLPRLLELVATRDFGWPDIEVLVGRLRWAAWRDWSEREQLAVEAFLMAKWRLTLSSSEPVQDPGDVLCAVAQAIDDLGPYLDEWLHHERATATAHLVEFVVSVWQPLRRRLSNEFWNDRPDQVAQVVEWLSSPGVHERLAEMATEPSNGAETDRALVALQALPAPG